MGSWHLTVSILLVTVGDLVAFGLLALSDRPHHELLQSNEPTSCMSQMPSGFVQSNPPACNAIWSSPRLRGSYKPAIPLALLHLRGIFEGSRGLGIDWAVGDKIRRGLLD
jgi:hypothetical protein